MMETIPFLLFLAIVFFVVFFIRVSRETIAKHTDWTSQDVPPRSEDTVEKPPLRVRTHNQNITVAAMQMAEKNSSPHLS